MFAKLGEFSPYSEIFFGGFAPQVKVSASYLLSSSSRCILNTFQIDQNLNLWISFCQTDVVWEWWILHLVSSYRTGQRLKVDAKLLILQLAGCIYLNILRIHTRIMHKHIPKRNDVIEFYSGKLWATHPKFLKPSCRIRVDRLKYEGNTTGRAKKIWTGILPNASGTKVVPVQIFPCPPVVLTLFINLFALVW